MWHLNTLIRSKPVLQYWPSQLCASNTCPGSGFLWVVTPYSDFRAELRHPFLQSPSMTIHPEVAVCFQYQSLEALETMVKHTHLRSHCLQFSFQFCCSVTWACSFIPLCLSFLITKVGIVMGIYVELMHRLNEMAHVQPVPCARAHSKHSDASYCNLRICMTSDFNCYLNLTVISWYMSCITVSSYICMKYMNKCTDRPLAKLAKHFQVVGTECPTGTAPGAFPHISSSALP